MRAVHRKRSYRNINYPCVNGFISNSIVGPTVAITYPAGVTVITWVVPAFLLSYVSTQDAVSPVAKLLVVMVGVPLEVDYRHMSCLRHQPSL